MLGSLSYQKICTRWPSTWAQTGVEAVEGFVEWLAEGWLGGKSYGQIDKLDLRMHQRRHRHHHRHHPHPRCLCQSNPEFRMGEDHMAFAAVVGAVVAEHEVVDKAGVAAMLGVGDNAAAQFAPGADGTEIEAGVEHEVGEADIEAGIGHEDDEAAIEAGVGHEADEAEIETGVGHGVAEAETGAVQLGVLGLN